MKKESLAQGAMIVISAVWGSTFIMVKEALNGVHPLTLTSFRFLIASFLLLPWVFKKRSSFRNALSAGCYLGIFLWILYLTQTCGLYFTSAANSGFLTGLFIVFIPIFLFFVSGVRIGKFQIFTIGLATFGVWLLTGGVEKFNIGDGLTIICASAYAAHVLLIDRYAKSSLEPVHLAFIQFFLVGFLSLLASLPIGERAFLIDPSVWDSIIFLTLFPTLLAFFIQLWAQKFVSPVKAGLIYTLEPAFAALFAWTVGGEEITWRGVLGGGLAFLAIFLTEFYHQRHSEAAGRGISSEASW